MYIIRQTVLIFTWIQTQNLILEYFFTFSWRYKWNRKVYCYAIHLIDHFKTDYTCRNGHFQGKTGLKKGKEKEQGPIQVFFIEVTSNLLVEVSMPPGKMKEAIPFRRDSLNHIPTHFVIRLDSKSILKPGPLDSSNPRSSSLNIPAHMNHSESWLLRRHFLPSPLSLSLRLTPLLKAGQEPTELWFGPGGRKGGELSLTRSRGLWDCFERERGGQRLWDSGCVGRSLHTEAEV